MFHSRTQILVKLHVSIIDFSKRINSHCDVVIICKMVGKEDGESGVH